MRKVISISLVSLALAVTSAQAKNDHNTGKEKLPPGLQKKVTKGGQLPPGWQKSYHKGDILDKDIYRRGKVVEPLGRDGLITIEVDDTLIHMVHDSREILSILSRYK